MKKFLITALALLVVVITLCLFTGASFADGGYVTIGENSTTKLSLLTEDQNYAFFWQSRISRYDMSKYDVRIVCVTREEWLKEIDNFAVTLTFTDGTTPITLKTVGFNTVFKSITALGKSGTVDTYVAESGTVLLGMIITEVPAEYVNEYEYPPHVSVATDASAKIEAIPPAIDYETPVQSMTDLDVITDGMVYFANKQDDGQIGNWRRQNNQLLTSKATYIVSGNYEGYYDLTITYTDTDGFNIAVIVNDTLFVVPITGTMKTSSWNVDAAKKVTITVPMKKGANSITFTAIDWASANLIDFDLTRNETYQATNTYTKAASDYTALSGVATTIPALSNGAESGTLVQLSSNSGTKVGSASYSLEGVEMGKYLLVMDYLTATNDREIYVWVDNQTAQKTKVINCATTNDLSSLHRVATYVEIPEGAESLNFKAYDQALCLYGYTLIRVNDDVTATPDVDQPDVDLDTVVLVKDDINIATDGVIIGATIQGDGQIGHMRDDRNASATYTLVGNYEGYYDLTIKYTDTDGLVITVSVNGETYSIKIMDHMKTSSWNVGDAKTVTITVPMKKGENIITFSAPSGAWAPNLVDFDLIRNETHNPDTAITKYAEDATLNKAELEPCTDASGNVAGNVIGYLGNGRSASFTIDAPAKGKYMLVIHYLTNANGRKYTVTVDGGSATQCVAANCGSNSDISVMNTMIFHYDLTQGSHTFTFGGNNTDWNPNVYSVSLVPVN